MASDGLSPLHAAALQLAVSERAGATQQQRVLAALLEHGSACTPTEVITGVRDSLGTAAHPAPQDVRRAATRLKTLDGRVIVVGDAGYPCPLQDAWPELGAPLWLFAAGGSVRLERTVPVAIVGTRRPSVDGLRTATALAAELARAGAVVVSGLARGIDQAAHRGALAAGGRTIAVLGTGLGVGYPSGSADLQRAITANGALLTELAPGVAPRAWQFLARNRIISGLASATVVVEGGDTSGALQTARLASGQGRDVWAVPGSINATTSRAPLALLRDGAIPLTSIDSFLEALGLWQRGPALNGASAPPSTLSANARRLLDLLSAVPTTTDALVAASRLPAYAVMAAIAELIECGVGVATPRGVVRG